MREYIRAKSMLAGFTLMSVSILVWNDKVSDTIYSAVVIATVGAFITSEAFDRAKP